MSMNLALHHSHTKNVDHLVVVLSTLSDRSLKAAKNQGCITTLRSNKIKAPPMLSRAFLSRPLDDGVHLFTQFRDVVPNQHTR
jgi:hypothetical protein